MTNVFVKYWMHLPAAGDVMTCFNTWHLMSSKL